MKFINVAVTEFGQRDMNPCGQRFHTFQSDLYTYCNRYRK
jgi:hypothetical protein